MGQPYTENPSNVFNPVVNKDDWLEIIDSGNSPSSSHFTNDVQEATLVGYIPWNKQRSAIAYFLGFAQVNSNFTLHRANPEAHPNFPMLYAYEISFTPFNPNINPANPSAPLQFVSPWYGTGNQTVTLNIAFHTYVVCTVRFRNFRYSFIDDSLITDPRMEWMRNVFLDLDPSVEALSADGIGQLTFAENAGGGIGGPKAGTTPFPAPLAELLAKATFTLNWLNVPFEFLSVETDYFYPSNIIDCLGKVNSQEFPFNSNDPFFPGQLLFDSVKFTQKTFPVAAADPSSPLVSVDVAMSLKYFDPPKGNTTVNSPYFGHNLMPWRGGKLQGLDIPDPTGGLYFYATRGGTLDGPPLLQCIDFNNIFISPNG